MRTKMRTRINGNKLGRCVSVAAAVLLVFLAVGTVVGQEPDPPLLEPEDQVSIAADPAKTMNYQGYLTDGSGNPLNGSYDMVFSLWDAEAAGAGTKEWGDETHAGVTVSKGLFSVALGETLALDPYTDFDEQLYLQITVNGTTMPRQMLRAVPYAMGLTSGAHVEGGTELGTQFALYVSNDVGRGIYANASGDDVYSVYSADVVYSDEGYAGPDTYVWLPVLDAVIEYADQSIAHLEPTIFGEMVIEADAAGTADVLIPIRVERPYGRDYVVEEARVYYRVDAAAVIDDAHIEGRDFATAAPRSMGSIYDDQSSTVYDYFDIDATQYYTVTTSMAPTNINLGVTMDSSAGTVWLYGVRLRLDSGS